MLEIWLGVGFIVWQRDFRLNCIFIYQYLYSWRIDRLDVEIYGDDSKRWTFYVDPNADMTKYSASKLNMKEDKT